MIKSSLLCFQLHFPVVAKTINHIPLKFTWLGSGNKLLFAIGANALSCKARDPNAIPRQRFHAVQSNMRHRSIYSHHVLDDGIARVFLAVVHVISL